MNTWSEQLEVPFPQCQMCGGCCKCNIPSIPTEELERRAKQGDNNAIDFLDIFIPYKNIEEARQVAPYTVEKSLLLCQKSNSAVRPEEIIFYHCKYIADNNHCLIHEDRPSLCRDFPDSPFLLLPQNCVYKNWAKECKEKYNELNQELDRLKKYQKELDNIKMQQKFIEKYELVKKLPEDKKFMAIVPQMSLISPKSNRIK